MIRTQSQTTNTSDTRCLREIVLDPADCARSEISTAIIFVCSSVSSRNIIAFVTVVVAVVKPTQSNVLNRIVEAQAFHEYAPAMLACWPSQAENAKCMARACKASFGDSRR